MVPRVDRRNGDDYSLASSDEHECVANTSAAAPPGILRDQPHPSMRQLPGQNARPTASPSSRKGAEAGNATLRPDEGFSHQQFFASTSKVFLEIARVTGVTGNYRETNAEA